MKHGEADLHIFFKVGAPCFNDESNAVSILVYEEQQDTKVKLTKTTTTTKEYVKVALK